MRPVLRERHVVYFQGLDADSINRIWTRHCEKHHEWLSLPPPATGTDLFNFFKDKGVDHAGAALPLVRETDEIGLRALELLTGQQVKPWYIPEEQPKPHPEKIKIIPQKTSDQDSLRVLSIKPNPKKAGSNAWHQYELWVVGKTIKECRETGLTRAAITWDIERNFVEVG